DKENDILYVRGNNIKKMIFRVYNRWGEKVFESKDQENGWDGTYEGKQLDPGVFAYYLEITCFGGVTHFEKGNVTLIR
ncbi:MAG: gliding motility-associated C-terminal domain-containing protein, partial [Flavobacteriales bacterium]